MGFTGVFHRGSDIMGKRELKWVNKPMIPAIYECPDCKKLIGFVGDGRLIYAREIFGYKPKHKYFGIDCKAHKCKIDRDGISHKINKSKII